MIEKPFEPLSDIERPLVVIMGEKEYTVQRLSSIKDIRPYLVCCVFKNLDLSGDNFKKFIAIQVCLTSVLFILMTIYRQNYILLFVVTERKLLLEHTILRVSVHRLNI